MFTMIYSPNLVDYFRAKIIVVSVLSEFLYGFK
jgi:hypothetical protein